MTQRPILVEGDITATDHPIPAISVRLAPAREQREHVRTPGPSSVGRTMVYIRCPFCDVETTAYLWSLSGSGKLCVCRAKHTALGYTEAPPDRRPPN